MSDYLHDLFSLDGRRAVVIGGTGVLCGQMASTLARAGASVIVAGRNAEKGAAVVQKIIAAGGAAAFVTADVVDHASLIELHNRVVGSYGPVDVLVNGAGINSATPYDDINADEWDRLLATNFTAVHQACQLFSRDMIERRRGSIINVASVSAQTPLSRVFAYSASKAAVVNYTQNLARELARFGVRVNCISPGFFPAEQNRKILDAERTAKILAHTPMNRFGEPQELDGAVLLLACERAGSFLTGANLVVDGGFSAMTI